MSGNALEQVTVMEIRSAEPMGKPSRVDVTRDADGEIMSAVVRGVKILGPKSANAHRGKPARYTDAAMASAVSLYEGMQTYIDHPDRSKPNAERSYRDRFGQLSNVSHKPGDGLYGDYAVNPGHACAKQFLWDAKNNPGAAGFSHNADAIGSIVGHEFVIESIKKVRSADVVSEPSTTVSLFESRQPQEATMPPESAPPPAKPAEPINTPTPAPAPAAGKPEAVTLLEARIGKLEESLKATATESDKLRVALAGRERKDRIDVLLFESKLPGFAITEPFKAALMEAKDEAAIKAAIEDRRAVARGSFHQEPGNPAPQSDPGAKPIESVETFLESIRKSGR